jgi:hypothetical protein
MPVARTCAMVLGPGPQAASAPHYDALHLDPLHMRLDSSRYRPFRRHEARRSRVKGKQMSRLQRGCCELCAKNEVEEGAGAVKEIYCVHEQAVWQVTHRQRSVHKPFFD